MNAFIDSCVELLNKEAYFQVEMTSRQHTIDKIAGIKWLDVTLKFIKFNYNGEDRYYARADIELKNVSTHNCDSQGDWSDTLCSQTKIGLPTREDVASSMVELIRILKTAKFDKRVGSFHKADHELFVVEELSSAEDCSICYEKTNTLTNCGHSVCIPCLHQLKVKTCPICRGQDVSIQCNCGC